MGHCTVTYAWPHDRSIHSIRIISDYASEHGLTDEQILANTGLIKQQLQDPNYLISGNQELQLIENVLNILNDQQDIGLEIGALYHFTTFGPLGLAWISSATVREGLEIALTYFSLTFAFTQFVFNERLDGIEIEVIPNQGVPQHLWRFVVERDMSCFLNILKDLAQKNICQKVDLTFSPSNHPQRYAEICGVMPEFLSERNCVVLSIEDIDLKLKMANELVLEEAKQQCHKILEKRQSQKKISAEVQTILMKTKGYMPTMEEVADILHTNSRTLRRNLSNEGTQFFKIREEVRQILAEHYLSNVSISIDKVAEWLGYSETSSFIHAYKRWYGKTPHASRIIQKVRRH